MRVLLDCQEYLSGGDVGTWLRLMKGVYGLEVVGMRQEAAVRLYVAILRLLQSRISYRYIRRFNKKEGKCRGNGRLTVDKGTLGKGS